MEPVKFKEANKVFGEGQPEYEPLPVYYDADSASGTVVSCWEISDEEMEEIIKTHKIYLSQMTFHKPINPVFMTPYKEVVIECAETEERENNE